MNENSVYVVIIRTKLLILKEYWSNWELIYDPVKVSSYKKKNKEASCNTLVRVAS